MRVLELELKACGFSVAIVDRVGARESLQLNAVINDTALCTAVPYAIFDKNGGLPLLRIFQ